MEGSAWKRRSEVARVATRHIVRAIRATKVRRQNRRIEVAKGIFIDADVPAQAVVSRDLAVKIIVSQGADPKVAEEYIDGLPVEDELAA